MAKFALKKKKRSRDADEKNRRPRFNFNNIMETVIDLIKNSQRTAFSFEILPPLKGNSIQSVYQVIDKLREFEPKSTQIGRASCRERV